MKWSLMGKENKKTDKWIQIDRQTYFEYLEKTKSTNRSLNKPKDLENFLNFKKGSKDHRKA